MKKYKQIIVAILIISRISSSDAQDKENINWYFGYLAGLNFETSPPTPLLNGKSATTNVTSTVSDNDGNLLFYTTGSLTWNSNHERLDNLDGYDGNSAQQVLSIKHIGKENHYYIFHITDHDAPNHLHRLNYSIIDTEIGKIVEKNIDLNTEDLTIKLSAIVQKGKIFWVIVQGSESDKYYCFKGTKDGIDPVPVVSSSRVLVGNLSDYGQIKFSPDGDQVSISNEVTGSLIIMDFDILSGKLRNPRSIAIEDVRSIEYSSDGNILYYTTAGSFCSDLDGLYQIILNENLRRIAIGSGRQIGVLQTGPDKKIYVGRRKVNCDPNEFIGVIENPNSIGSNSGFKLDAVHLGGKASWQGLPNIPREYVCPDHIEIERNIDVCNVQSYTIDLTSFEGDISWQGGSNEKSFTVTESGTYWVESSTDLCTQRDSFSVDFINIPDPMLNDTIICGDDDFEIKFSIDGFQNVWSDGSTGDTFNINNSDDYFLELQKGNCSKSFSFSVFFENRNVNFEIDTLPIFDKPVTLLPTEADRIVWQDGYEGPKYEAFDGGYYSFRAYLNSCVYEDSIFVEKRNYFIPNVYTPNGDGYNDQFELDFIKPGEKWLLQIFDRNGKLIFESVDYGNNWSEGLPGQVYFYRLFNEDFDVNANGFISVLD